MPPPLKRLTFEINETKKYIAYNIGYDTDRDGADFCEQRWSILRNRFCTEKRKYVPSGSGSDAVKQTWPLFNNMKFIDEFIVPRRTHSNVKVLARQSDKSSCAREDEPRPSCSAQASSSNIEDPLELGASTPWVSLVEEQETADANTDTSEYTSTPGLTPHSESTPTNQNMNENTEHELETSVLRSKSKMQRKNPETKLADTIHNAFGILNKHFEKLSEPAVEDLSSGLNKMKSAKKRYLLKAEILQMMAENKSDDE
ncbi:jing interacting gene regulatory 1, partial [Carabus blaptoides fortunei]